MALSKRQMACFEGNRVFLDEVAAALRGPGEQLPPMYSAVKIAGRKLYEHARAGETVERKARPVVQRPSNRRRNRLQP